MGAIATSWAWCQKDLSSTTKFILLALSEVADDEHRSAVPLDRLAALTGLSETTLRKSLTELAKADLIRRAGDVIRVDPNTQQNKLVAQYRLVVLV